MAKASFDRSNNAKSTSSGITRRHSLKAFAGAAAALGIAVRSYPTRAGDLLPLRILGSGNGWAASEIVILAEEFGYFRKEGLKLDLVLLPAERLTVALEGGITDFVPNAHYIYFVNIKDKGLKGHQVVSTSPYSDPRLPSGGLFVRENSKIRGPEDLRDKTIGLTVLQFASAWFTLAYLEKAGLKRDDINLIAIPGPQHEQVLSSGDVDAVYTSGAVEASLRRRGGFRKLFTTTDIAGRRISAGSTIVRDDYARDKPDIVRRYVAAIGNTIEWANRNQEEIFHYAIKTGKVNAALAPFLYTPDGGGDYSVLRWPDHGLQNRDDVKFWIDVGERIGIVSRGKLAPEDIYTDQFNSFA
ncbi:ABC transporter substrate-binding protein [Methylocystis parvus]|uniref:ABC transporter substrate-binding protein n=1 Tax=Methylocystis parvus TaxID=134 RepID=A0A6B8M5F3_9HYPH|nr:ABC transporter substrate-binding protein [Methylocystis parvus]QGM97565.1 ABC transporter substrate-binding protein [Methylocystis parvus]WBJ98505.1 ABC transporter substrate-binding protein [Methylocystis parvus OBBP]